MICKKVIGNNIGRARYKANLSMADLAEKVNQIRKTKTKLDRCHIFHYEAGKKKIRASIFFCVCLALKIAPDEMVREKSKLPLWEIQDPSLESEAEIQKRFSRNILNKLQTANFTTSSFVNNFNDIAWECGVYGENDTLSPTTAWRYLNGIGLKNLSIEKIAVIAKLLGSSLEDLLKEPPA